MIPKHSDDRILVLIPAYNEENQVAAVVDQVQKHALPVLVVDDGSTDETATRARATGATVLRLEGNEGKGRALQAGIHCALQEGYDAILTLDADGQHDPAEIPLFLEAYAQHQYDLLIGARNFDDMPWTRYTMNMLGRWTFTWVMGEPMLDNQSGYRLLTRRLAAAALASNEEGYEFEVDMIVICLRSGYKLGWVPIQTIYNEERSHINHVKHVYNYLRLLWRVRQQLQETE